MASGRILLSAKNGNPVLADASFKPRDACAELRSLGEFIVEDTAFGIVEIVAAGPAPELVAKIDILETTIS
jgi:hypothetical protein